MRLLEAFDAAACSCLMSLFALVTAQSAASPRYLVYPPPGDGSPTKVQLVFGLGIPMEVDVSTIVGYVMKCNYNLPYNASYLGEPYLRHRRSAPEDAIAEPSSSASSRHDPTGRPGDGIGRYDIYKIIELAANSVASEPAKGCLLRAICEAAATPFDHDPGVFAQLLHILLTPSSTGESQSEPSDQEYLAAESAGVSGDCSRFSRLCGGNILEYFSLLV